MSDSDNYTPAMQHPSVCVASSTSVAGRLAAAVASGLWQRHACRSTQQPTRQTAVSSQCCRTSCVFGTETRACHIVAPGLALAACTSARWAQAGHARLSLSGTIVPSWGPTTRGRSRIEATTSFVIVKRARRSTISSLHRRRPSLSGFSCSRLERTAGTCHIVDVVTYIQTLFEDILFLPKVSLRRFAIDITNNYHHCISVHVELWCFSFYVFRGLVANLPPYAMLIIFMY